MDWTRAQGSLKAAQLCLEQQLLDSAVSRAYFAAFQAAICALESQGITHKEWTHKGVHNDFVPASFASALPNLMRLRHTGDYRQPGVSHRQAERAIRLTREFVELLITEVWHAQETPA